MNWWSYDIMNKSLWHVAHWDLGLPPVTWSTRNFPCLATHGVFYKIHDTNVF